MAEMAQFGTSTPSTVLCCLCGTPIPANPANMCVNCIRTQVDITEGLPKQLTVPFCKTCERYFQPPNAWIYAQLESRQLLAICLKRMKGLNKVRLVDASFVWTEPHSKRLKVKLTVQKEVFSGTVLQQAFVVEYVVQWQQCTDCQRTEASLTWRAVAQVRQKVDHKRTFYWLEQLILKHGAHRQCNSIKEMPDGLDFYFDQRSQAAKFVEFVAAVAPVRLKTAKELISHDIHSNNYNYKYSFSTEIAPICKDDLVCLPLKLAQHCGYISPLLLCFKSSNVLHFVDPYTLQKTELGPQQFFHSPFRAISNRDRLIPYIVLDVSRLGPTHGRMALAEVTVAKESDLGVNDLTYVVNSHMGYILHAGDTVLGFDLAAMNFNDNDVKAIRGKALPDVMLVRKTYPRYRERHRSRAWKLQHMTIEADEQRRRDADKDARDMEIFLRDVEEDPEMREQINLFAEPGAAQATESDTDEEQFPGPRMRDLLQSMEQMKIEEMDTTE